MKKVKNILLLLTALFTLGCSQTIVFEDIQTPTPTPTPKPEPEPDDKQLTSAPYAVGDYYYDGTKEGVVFDVWDNGNSGKIVSMTQSANGLQWSSDETEQKRLIGADSETDGAYNTAKVKAISGWETMYPAFKWCADLGDDWYLPAKEELLTIYNNKDKLNTNLTDKLSSYYWSSTEYDYQFTTGEFCAWRVGMSNGYAGNSIKSLNGYVRAVATFGDVPKPEPEPDLDYSTATDLSAEGTANCYLVKAAGTYKFKAVKGNSAQSVGAASSADVLWESFGTSITPNVGDLIASATYKDGYVYFATPNTFKNGNATIAVRDSSGTILWSWHIWCSTEGWKDDIYPNNAGTMMDRNLGATSATPGSVGALGLLYQWGRKDPFLGSSSISRSTLAVSTGSWSSVYNTQQTVDYVTANPMIFVGKYGDWCTGDGAEDSNYAKRWTESIKSMYDPCPVGYRVPDGGSNGFWATALGTSSKTSTGTKWDSTNCGCHWTLADGESTAWYPVVGSRSYDSALYDVGSDGNYWSASPHPSDSDVACYLLFYDGNVYPANSILRGLGQSVRCVSTTATSNPNPEPEPTKGYIVPENAKRVTFEIDGSLEAYTNVADQFNIADLVKGANTNATVQMAYLNDNDLLAWQDWTITDGWFGLNGATSWGNGNIACVKPKTDGSFEYVGLMDGQAIGTKATAIFDYGNDIIVAITVEIVAPEVSNVVYSENCGSTISKVDGYWPYVDMYTGWSRQGGNGCDQSGVTYTGVNASVRDNGAEYKPDSGASYASDAPYAYISYKTNSNFGINNIKIDSSTKSYSLSFTAHNQYACLISSPYTPATTPLKSGEHVKLYVSVDGQNWGVVQFATVANGNWEYATAPFTLPTNADTLHIKFADLSIGTLSLPSTEYQHIASLRLDDFCLTKGGNGPTLNFDHTFDEQLTPEPTEPANNEIWYTSTDGAVIAHNSGSVSGANIVSNTYTNGKGVLTFDGNVTKILSYPFSAKSKLKSIVLPNSVTHIYTQAFGNCYNLVDVDLGSGLTYIGNAAFDACRALTSITIPDSVTFIGPAPFLACYNLANFYGAAATDDHKGLVIDNTFVSFAPAGPTEYSIPHGVTVIQDGSFNDCQKITKVTIPATVVEIEEQAFYRCYALSVVNCLPTTPPTLLMHSSYGTFDSNASGRKIYVPASSVSAYKSASGWSTYADAIVADPASEPTPEPTEPANNEIWYTSTDGNVVTPYDADVFGASIVSNTYNDGKGVITFDGEITQIGKDAFSSRPKLTSIIIPESVTLIGSYAFNCCSGLIGITLPDGVTSIGNGAFNDCSSLTSITIPDSIIEIGGRAFEDCSSLTSITIPNNITSLENWTFKNCSNLKEVYYTGDLSAWCKILFEGDTANPMSNSAKLYIDNKEIAEVTIPSDITEIKNFTFSYCRSLTSITVTDNVTSIGSCAFYNCDGLTSIIIPDSVTEIDSWAFRDCGYLESVTIGNFVTHIGYYAFMDNHRLKKVYCRSIAPPYIEPGLFDNNASDRKIYVPASSVSAYKSASGWSTYADAIVADPSTFTSAPYAVGDYYYDGTKEGVVFDVWDNGNSGKIVSMTQSASGLQWSSDETEQKRLIGADSETDGAANMAVVKAISGWETKYPAFKWCADLGEGWYMPAKEELYILYNNKIKVAPVLKEQLDNRSYWSSTERNTQYSGIFCAWSVHMNNGAIADSSKYGFDYVRAAATFGDTPKPGITSAPYAVGDYYNDGTKEGVVFEVSADGTSGKIVSMMQSTDTLQWSSDETEQKRLIGADSETDGAANMAVVKAISGWETKYPAFKWCADLGDEWYLPAKEELLTIYNNKDKLNTNLTDKLLADHYWSSTEDDYQLASGQFCAWYVNMSNGYTGRSSKDGSDCVRAVSAF